MRRLTTAVFVLISLLLVFYLALPNPGFPQHPPDSVQSLELSEIETPLRRGYFTNYTREEVMDFYKSQLKRSFFGIPLPTYRLNYPPEDAQFLIRDQTRSTFLEEIVHPFRESLFINGFEPKDPKDDVWYKGVDYRQKIIVRYVPSSPLIRMPIIVSSLGLLYLVLFGWSDLFSGVLKKKNG